MGRGLFFRYKIGKSFSIYDSEADIIGVQHSYEWILYL